MSVFTNINLGLRYVLPIFPYLFISARQARSLGRPGSTIRAATIARWAFVGIGLTALTVAATASIHPHYLAYFNAVSGGPDRGAEHLIDSNLDWGQDLVGLRRWLGRQRARTSGSAWRISVRSTHESSRRGAKRSTGSCRLPGPSTMPDLPAALPARSRRDAARSRDSTR